MRWWPASPRTFTYVKSDDSASESVMYPRTSRITTPPDVRSTKSVQCIESASAGRGRHAALEARRLIGAAAPFVDGRRGVEAQRARAIDSARLRVRRRYRERRCSLLHPVLERGEHVERARPWTARTVLHARHHEQAEER